jgi:hypothetical protein
MDNLRTDFVKDFQRRVQPAKAVPTKVLPWHGFQPAHTDLANHMGYIDKFKCSYFDRATWIIDDR